MLDVSSLQRQGQQVLLLHEPHLTTTQSSNKHHVSHRVKRHGTAARSLRVQQSILTGTLCSTRRAPWTPSQLPTPQPLRLLWRAAALVAAAALRLWCAACWALSPSALLGVAHGAVPAQDPVADPRGLCSPAGSASRQQPLLRRQVKEYGAHTPGGNGRRRGRQHDTMLVFDFKCSCFNAG